jgi:hypothetical protein
MKKPRQLRLGDVIRLDRRQGRLKLRRFNREELAGMRADLAARFAGLERKWKASRDTDYYALLGALVFYQGQLPPWLFTALFNCVREKLRPGRGQSSTRAEQGAKTAHAVHRYRELRKQHPSKSADETIDTVLSEMGESAPFDETLRNAVRRSRYARQRRRKKSST